MAADRLFVYGSLKRGALHHAELEGAPFLGEARTPPGYALELVGQYWALVERPGEESSVPGELYEVTEELLARLDEFEGDGYVRGRVRLTHPYVSDEAALEPAAEKRGPTFALAYLKRTR